MFNIFFLKKFKKITMLSIYTLKYFLYLRKIRLIIF